jgi:glycine cleavage system H protein
MIKFLKSHEWVRVEGNIGTIGISDHAQNEMGDIVYVELPEIGTKIKKGETFMSMESAKSAEDVYAPVSGTVKEVNTELEDSPELVNEDAEGKGWFVKVELDDPSELDDLIGEEDYRKSVEG